MCIYVFFIFIFYSFCVFRFFFFVVFSLMYSRESGWCKERVFDCGEIYMRETLQKVSACMCHILRGEGVHRVCRKNNSTLNSTHPVIYFSWNPTYWSTLSTSNKKKILFPLFFTVWVNCFFFSSVVSSLSLRFFLFKIRILPFSANKQNN